MFISKDIVFIEEDDDDYFEKNKIKFNVLAYVSKKWPKTKQGEMKPNTKRRLKGECRGIALLPFSIVCLLNSKRQSAQKAGKRQRR